MIFPYKTDLPLFGKPYISITVITLCVLVFLAQSYNRSAITDSAVHYCESIYNSEFDDESPDRLRINISDCIDFLLYSYVTDEYIWVDNIGSFLRYEATFSLEYIDNVIELLKEHDSEFSNIAPYYLDGFLMHYPDSLNPLPMVLSSLAHADFLHILFNAIFFLAFAPALELLIDNKKKFIITLIAISVITCLAYSLSILITYSRPIPTLGLSGVVMGMIGLAGYLIPRANIGFIFWFVVYKRIFIPAWIVATWYIGWDIWNMLSDDGASGINFVSHVAGGISGYVIGIYYYSQEKLRLKEDLDEAIIEACMLRLHGNHNGMPPGGRRELRQRQMLKNNKDAFEKHMDKIFRYVRQDSDSDAIVLFLDLYDSYSTDLRFMEELFERVMSWGDSRAGLCVGRILIHLLCQKHKYAWAYRITEQCLAVSSEFVFADIEDEKMMNHLNQAKYTH